MARLVLALLLLLSIATPVRAADPVTDILRFLEMLSPKAEAAPATESAVETQIRYLERDLDRLRGEVKALPEARRLDRLEAEIVGLRAEIKAAEKSAEEAVKERLEAQDTRIEDLSLVLADGANLISKSSMLVTVILFTITLFTAFRVPAQAKEAAREKAEEIAGRATQDAVKRATEEAEKAAAAWIAEKAERKLEEIEIRAREQRDDITKRFAGIISQISVRPDPPLSSTRGYSTPGKLQDPSVIAEEQEAVAYILSVPAAQRTLDHWRALTKHLIEQHSYEAALSVCNEWLAQPGQTSLGTAVALLRSGYCLGSLAPPNLDAAITAYNAVINRFGSDPTPALREEVAKALVNKGIDLCNLTPPSFDSAIATYDDVVNRFGTDPAPALSVQVAWALFNKGVTLSKLSHPQPDAEIATYDEVIHRFGSNPAPALRAPVAKALCNKGITLSDLNRPTEARRTYNDYLDRFAGASEPEIQALTITVRDALAKLPPAEPPTPADS